jgi:hypothetical protein
MGEMAAYYLGMSEDAYDEMMNEDWAEMLKEAGYRSQGVDNGMEHWRETPEAWRARNADRIRHAREMSELLHQDLVWASADGPIRLTEMTSSHAYHVIRLLRERANSLYKAETVLSDPWLMGFGEPQGDMAGWTLDIERHTLLEMNAMEWLEQTTLYRALHDRANSYMKPMPFSARLGRAALAAQHERSQR